MRSIQLFIVTAAIIIFPTSVRGNDLLPGLGVADETNSHSLRASVDFLYWKARRSGQDFAVSDPNTDDNIEGTIQGLELESSGGVRASLGCWAACDWDLGITYTHFESDDQRSVNAAPGGQLWLTRTSPASFNNIAASSSAEASLDYDLLDLEAGYWFRSNELISVRIFGGPRGAWTRQEMNMTYSGGSITGARTQTQRTKMNGFGLRAGSRVHWHLGQSLSLFGSVAGSALAGDFESEYTENEPGFSNGNVSTRLSYFDAVPGVELATGFDLSLRRISIQAGYELTSWMNLGQRTNFTGAETIGRGNLTPTSHDLILDGLFVRAVFTH